MVAPPVELENTTDLRARMFRGEPEPGLMLCVVVAKVAFEIRPDGSLSACPADEVEILEEAAPTPAGLLPSDQVPYRPGVDLFVHARAHAPRGRPTPAMEVALQLGRFEHRLLVIGDRRWTRAGHPSSPEPFVTLPLTYDRAYGGQATSRGQLVAWPDNPEGRGFVYEESTAEGTVLPNVENPAQRITSWRDRPKVMGWAPVPQQTATHLRRSIDIVDAETYAYRFTPQVFSSAHPDLVLPELAPGTQGMLAGVDPSGRFAFSTPMLELAATVELGPKQHDIAASLDTLGILVDTRRLLATYRVSFRYRFVPKQIRRVRLAVADRPLSRAQSS